MNKIDVFIINHVDPDGYCAGAVVNYHEKLKNPQANIVTYGMNRGYDIPWNRIKRAKKVYVVDFSLPVGDMLKIKEIVGHNNLIWIDHHATVIEDYQKAGLKLEGIAEVGKSGCELCWIYFNYDIPMPKAVKAIGRYDVWDIEYNNPEEGIFKEDLFPFVTGYKYHDAKADDDHFWSKMFKDDGYYEEVLKEGRLLYDYQSKMFAKYCKSHSFEIEWEGLRFLCVNSLNCNSQMFDSCYNPHKHDAFLAYGYTNKNWSVSMYTPKTEVDVGAIAKKYGGGGHKNGCGFRVTELPFEDLIEWKEDI
jgi:oligoribonuclease NrnB/cAMP/cGMP phosphodiesterase (DHH superfamily)